MRSSSRPHLSRGWLLATVLAVTFAAGAAQAETPTSRLLSTSLSFRAGVLDSRYSYFGGGFGDLYAIRAIEGRYEWNGWLGEASLLSPSKFAFGLGEGATVTLRLGYSGERWALLAGPSMQLNPFARSPLQLLPSVHARYSFGSWGLRAGILDMDGMVPAHVGVEVNGFGLSYVAPVGALAHARFRVIGRGHITAQAMFVRLFNTTQAFATVGAEMDLGPNPVPGWNKESK